MIRSYVILLWNICLGVSAYEIILKNNGPIVKGGTIHCEVVVYSYGEIIADDNLRFDWSDNAIPQHTKTSPILETGTDVWDVTYNASVNPPGAYIAQVVVHKCWLGICLQRIGSARTEFDITDNLNGQLQLEQHNTTLTNYVSTKEEVTHFINLTQTDKEVIDKAPVVRTYWFIDCTYYGITNSLAFPFNYSISNTAHFVEALVMADFSPPVPSTTVPPSTTTTSTTVKPTTTKPTASTTATTTTSTTTASTSRSTTTASTSTSTITTVSTSTSVTTKKLVKRFANDTGKTEVSSDIKKLENGTIVVHDINFPYVCNSTYISADQDKTYGYFYKKFEAKDPLSKVNVTGNNWLQPGDLLSLRIRCSGSNDFKYCVKYKKGEYNVTGHETCDQYQHIDKCDFTIKRYLSNPKNTIVIIIKNDINKEVTNVTVNIYEVKKQGQLSVVVVPVAFSLVAVVLIVFGVAYYFQNRSRFVIEVADFNFGQQYTDLEYKTFRERLRDSISNAFTRSPTPSSSEVPVWPPGRKYGSMT